MAITRLGVNNISNSTIANITALPAAIATGAMVKLSTQTASSSSTISFTSGIDSTYKHYIFYFADIHGSGDGVDLKFQVSTDGGSSYGVTCTTAEFLNYNNEAGSDSALSNNGNHDLSQSTNFMQLSQDMGAGETDQSAAGTLHLFNPSSTTFVKHYLSRFNNYHDSNYSMSNNGSGYFNTTSAINAVQFKMSTGTMDSGTITLYGVTT